MGSLARTFADLLADVSHGLTNPLSVIVAQAALLELESCGSSAARATKIRRAGERAALVLKSFLANARQGAADVSDRTPIGAALDDRPLPCRDGAGGGGEKMP